jgi:ATP-dependent helicase HrpB
MNRPSTTGDDAALPIDAVLPDVVARLADAPCLVLEAPPGAGKSTRVPLSLLAAPWFAGRRIIMLQPRRVAARAVAGRLAANLGEPVGRTVGYRMRMESRVSRQTRLEVVTEGVLVRRLQRDPALDGVDLVIFDEFHERSMDADLSLALSLEVQAALRGDLKIMVMSATLDGAAVADLLGRAPVIRATGRLYPVRTEHVSPALGTPFDVAMARLIGRALDEEDGGVLVFLPGEGEIRRVAERLTAIALPDNVDLIPLYGGLALAEQQRALAPAAPGRRKVVLATNIAETSLTIDGIRIVVDGGLRRFVRYDSGAGMARLETGRISKASATQRAGRAGRLEAGVCYRLWNAAEERGFAAFDAPEILQADLSALALNLAQWGVREPTDLAWLDPPSAGSFQAAVALLRRLGAVDGQGAITPLGRRMAALPLHPRLARMVLDGVAEGQGPLGCAMAALLSERDPLYGRADGDFRRRLDWLQSRQGAAGRIAATAAALRCRLDLADAVFSSEDAGRLLVRAYPDRLAERRGAAGRFLLVNGRGGAVPIEDSLAAADLLAVADMQASAGDGRIRLAAPISRAEVEEIFAEDFFEQESVDWNSRTDSVAARRQRRLGALVWTDRPLDRPDPDLVIAATLAGIRRHGLSMLPWTDALQALRARVAFLRRAMPDAGCPDLSDSALDATLDSWLAPYLAGIQRRSDFAKVPLAAAMNALIPNNLAARMDSLAPRQITVPSGSVRALDYTDPETPVLAVRLQEMFGLTETPTILDGRCPVLLHLLSPAGRPLAVTRDIASFWQNAYPGVRAEMKGRYPKHAWPDDPLTAAATARAKRRR